MSTTDEIRTQMETYLAENEKFTGKGVKASATRARKALQEMGKFSTSSNRADGQGREKL